MTLCKDDDGGCTNEAEADGFCDEHHPIQDDGFDELRNRNPSTAKLAMREAEPVLNTEIERDEYLIVVTTTPERAKAFVEKALGGEDVVRIEDAGPADPGRYKDGARIFHVYTEPRSEG